MNTNTYTIADLGSSRISLLAAEVLSERRVRVRSAESIALSGYIKYGVVSNSTEVAYHIKKLAKQLQNSARMKEVGIICVSLNAKTMNSVSVNIERKINNNRVITDELLESLASECVDSFEQREGVKIFDIIPLTYELDGQRTDDPTGEEGSRITGFYNLVLGQVAIKEELEKTFTRIDTIDLEDYYPLAVEALATVLLSNEEKERGCALLNLGATTTTLATYKEGMLQKIVVIPLGGEHITMDISEQGISKANAERLKCLKGSALSSLVKESLNIKIPNIVEGKDSVVLNTKFLSRIIEERLFEIMLPIFKILDDSSFELEAGVVLTGGGVKLNNIFEFVEKNIKLPLRFGDHSSFLTEDVSDEFFDPIYAQSIGTAILLDEYYQKSKTDNESRKKEDKSKKGAKKIGLREKVSNLMFNFFDDDKYLE